MVIAELEPALLAAMDVKRREVEAIANDPTAPSFDNTVAALEDAGRTLDRVEMVYDVWSTSMNTSEFKAVEKKMAPKLAAFSDEIAQNDKVFRRVEAVYGSPEKEKLTPEQQRLVWRHYTSLVRATKSPSGLRPGACSPAAEWNWTG